MRGGGSEVVLRSQVKVKGLQKMVEVQTGTPVERPIRSGWYAVWVSAALAALAGCAAHQPHMMVTPVLYRDPRLDFISRVPSQFRTTELPVYYETTRAPAKPGDAEHYSSTPGQELRLGTAHIRLGEPG